jgi:acyl carrier protein
MITSREQIYNYINQWIDDAEINKEFEYELCDTLEEIGFNIFQLLDLVNDLEEKYNIYLPMPTLETKLISIIDAVRESLFEEVN